MTMLHRFVCAVLIAFAPLLPAVAQPLPAGVVKGVSVEGIDEYRLSNGLQVLLVPDDSKPTTTVNLTLRVGSRHEGYGETGMAHLLEHMMFKGTPKHPKVWAEFEKRGLAANGTTGMDRTNYTASFSANEENLNWYVGWLADAMVNSFISRKDLDTEMTVVRNEMEMGENSPERTLYKKTLATMFDWHNYGKDTIGARADVENVDIPRLQAFYRTYYQPDNASLIVSGKFVPAKVLSTVAASFGKVKKPSRKLPALYTLDPAQDGERSVTVRRVGGTPVMFAGYHVPAGADPDYAAIEVLSYVMGDTPSGRLHKRLTEKQLAAGTFAFAQAMADPGFAIFGAQLAPGLDTERARSEMLATLESTAAEPVSDAEVKRAKAKWLKAWEQAYTNPEAVGHALSEYVALGDWRLFFLLRDRVRDVQPADVQRVATQYLVPANRTLGTYVPTGNPQRAPDPRPVDVAEQLKSFKPQLAAAAAEAFEATPANIDKRTQHSNIGGLKVALLPKGTRGGAVHAHMRLRFGDEKTLFGHGDVPDMVAALLDKGTRTMTREQLQDRLDELKTEVSIGADAGVVSVSLMSRKEHLPAAIALVGEMLRAPSFPADALDEVKRQSLASIEQQRKRPESVAANAVGRASNPYPKGDVRYTPTFDEMVANVNAVTLDKVREFHSRFYGAKRGEFAAVGDLDVAAVRQALQSAFGDWDSGVAYTRVPRPLVPSKPERLMLPVPDNQNATMMVRHAFPLSDNDADYPAFMMANYLLGSGGNSRLWKRIREGEGLSYDVRSQVEWSGVEQHSTWIASAIFAPQNQAKVEAAFKEELARALKDGFTAQELAEGQRGLLNYRRLSRAQDPAIAGAWARNLYLGRTFEISVKVDAALARLTVAEVNAALRKYLLPEQLVSVFAGDFKN
ncbi:zinc protease [Burkholderiaceae bacterium]|nr:zinc protease [Burkholderiaceae bacterium]